MSSFILKLIALLSMTVDHTGKALFINSDIFNIIGRIAFPLFAFQIVEGYTHIKNIKKYLLRLFLVAVISQFVFYELFHGLNTIFTLLIGLLCILIYEKQEDKVISISLILVILLLSILFNLDYGLYGLLVIIFFYVFRESKVKKSIAFTILTVIHYSLLIYTSKDISLLLPMSTTLSSLIFINLYNNKKGKSLKYLFYIYYPLHLCILWIITLFIK